MDAPSTVFVVDDEAPVRTTIASITATIGLAAIGFPTVDELLEAYDDGACCCVVADVRLPGTSGLELLSLFPSRGFASPIILISGYADVDLAVEAMKKGAYDFLQKPFSARRLIEAVQGAARLSMAQFADRQAKADAAARVEHLTEREWDVAQLLIEGLKNKDIARRLDLSHRTVEKHRHNIWLKTGIQSLPDLVKLFSAADRRYFSQAHRGHPGVGKTTH